MKKRQLSNFTKDWSAKEYLQQYYSSNKINSDEIVTLKYMVDFLKKSNTIFDRAIEVGSGPTLHQIIPLIPYVKILHLSDFLPQNLDEIKKWLEDDPDAHDWDIYIKYVLTLEGRGESLEKRKKDMRKVITKLLHIDIYKRYPLGSLDTYPLVTSFYCADSISKNKQEWKKCMTNIFTLVQPDGLIFLAALRNASSYQVTDQYFPSANINEKDFKDLFQENSSFVKSSLDIQVLSNPEWLASGFDSCMFVKAEAAHVNN